MNILVIDTSGDRVQIALSCGDKTKYYINKKKEMASAVLLPEVQRLLAEFNISANDINYFAAVIGPGSFTGIRIGVASVRAFCQSLNKKAVAVNRLSFLAYINRADCEYKVSVVDGQNGIVYISVLSSDASIVYLEPKCIKITDLHKFLMEIDEDFIIISDSIEEIEGYNVYYSENTIEELVSYVKHKIANGEIVSYNDVEPIYIRKAQAERMAGEL